MLTMSRLACVLSICLALSVEARTFDFKYLGAQGTSDGNNTNWYTTKTKRAFYQIKVGSALKSDSKDEIEVRAATVMKNIKDKKMAVNDIATFKFAPINVGKAIFLEVASGTSYSRIDNDRYFSDYSHGWQLSGCYIEIRQGGKIIKKYSGAKGLSKNIVLDDKIKQMRLNEKGDEVSEYGRFENVTEIYCTTSDRKRLDIEEVLAQFSAQTSGDESTSDAQEKKDEKTEEDATPMAEEDVVIKKFCGYEFGAAKPELEGKGSIKMARPFRHYEYIRPTYGPYSGKLVALALESRQPIMDRDERSKALNGVALLFEKKYGIQFENSGDCFYFNNPHLHIYLTAHRIEVRNLDCEKQERRAADAQREKLKRSGMNSDADKDADVL